MSEYKRDKDYRWREVMPFIEFFARKEPFLAGVFTYTFFVTILLFILLLMGFNFVVSLLFSLILITGCCVLAIMIVITITTWRMVVRTVKQRYYEWKIDNNTH
jgi:hypothetical protein